MYHSECRMLWSGMHAALQPRSSGTWAARKDKHRCTVHAQVDPARFGRVREALALRYANSNMSPGKHASYLRLRALKHVWHVDDALRELNALTLADVQARMLSFQPSWAH